MGIPTAVLVLMTSLPLSSASGGGVKPNAIGIWENELCVVQERNGVQSSSKSTFVFLEREWALEFTQFADPQCNTPMLKAFFHGTYEITQPSKVVTAAHDATFGFSRKRLTLYDVALLTQANRTCGGATWKRGEAQDVSETGCLWIVPVSACAHEFDLIQVDGHRLFLGERPPAGQDLCSEDRRASRLRSSALVRR